MKKLLLCVAAVVAVVLLASSCGVINGVDAVQVDEEDFTPTLDAPEHQKPQIEESEDEPTHQQAEEVEEVEVEPKEFDITEYWMECLVGAGLIAYAINYILGRRKNVHYATTWAALSLPIMTEQCAVINLKESRTVIQESSSDFVLYGTGRRYIKSVTAHLQLARRYDLSAFSSLNGNTPTDFLHIFIDFLPSVFPTSVCAITTVGRERKMLQDYPEVASFTKPYPGSRFGLPNSMVVRTDCTALVEALLNEEIIRVLDKYQHCLLHVILSDQTNMVSVSEDGSEATSRYRMLSLKLALPSEHLTSCRLQTLALKLAFVLVDKIATTHLPATAYQHAEKLRREVQVDKQKQTHEDRMQQGQERREARLREERIAAEKKGPDALQKWEDQQHKRRMQRERNKFMMRS